MNIEEIVQNPLMSWGGLLMGIMTLVQVAPIEISPWSWLAKKIGRAINGEVLKKLGEVERRLDKHIVDLPAKDDLSARVEALAADNERLMQEIAALEEKIAAARRALD